MLTLTDFRAVVVYLRKAFLNTLGARDEHVTVCRLLLAAHTTSAALLLLRLFLEQQQNWKKQHEVENPSSAAGKKYRTFFARLQILFDLTRRLLLCIAQMLQFVCSRFLWSGRLQYLIQVPNILQAQIKFPFCKYVNFFCQR
jgi:hypothetical protein